MPEAPANPSGWLPGRTGPVRRPRFHVGLGFRSRFFRALRTNQKGLVLKPMATAADVSAALKGLHEHPDDHGWHPFYEVLEKLFGAEEIAGGGPLSRIVNACYESRPNLTAPHFVTLLCIVLKGLVGDWRDSPVFDLEVAVDRRAAVLKVEIDANEKVILEGVLTRQNSFSSARRFLIPQVLISHFAARAGMSVRLADLGTGAGLLPRQLNSRSNYQRFAPDLVWQDWDPPFVEVPYEVRWGVDRISAGDTAWFRQCYGPSTYYDRLYAELDWAFAQPEVGATTLHPADLDLLGPDKLSRFLQEQRINVVTCSYVLYQYEAPAREAVVAAVVSALPEPGLFVSLEPTRDLLDPGAVIRAYLPGDPTPIEVGIVSNGHCLGGVAPGKGFPGFRRDYL